MGGKLCKAFCPKRAAPQHNSDATLPLNARRISDSTPLPKIGASQIPHIRGRLDSCIDVCLEASTLSVLPHEQLESIASFLDVATFAFAISPSCLFFYQVVRKESFQGWLDEIKRLHELCPWTMKTPFEKLIQADPDLYDSNFCTALRRLDRSFVTTGAKVMKEDSRIPCVITPPPFFACQKDTLVYACKSCKSFITLVDSTVGRGTMGMRKAALIVQPNPSFPFCCALQEDRQTQLTSGLYIVADLICPNGNCNASLGWKYQCCLPDPSSGTSHVPLANRLKTGQFWMYADSLEVVTPCGSFEGCRGEDFYFMNVF